jgi:hypothetical protein
MKEWNTDALNLHRRAPGDPHCPAWCGKECPVTCPNHGRMFDGCHVCDCLHGKPKEEAHAPNQAR